MKVCVLQEMSGLLIRRLTGGKEMVGTNGNFMCMGTAIVGSEIFVDYRYAFCRFDINEGDWIIGATVNKLFTDAPTKLGDAQMSPVNGINRLVLVVLIT